MQPPHGWRTLLATLLVVAAGTLAVAGATRGFAAVTSDGARRIDLAHAPRALPPIALLDSDGRIFSLADIHRDGTPATFVTLVYTQCLTVCRTSASGQTYLQAQLHAAGQTRGQAQVARLLTISFDPQRDTPAVLARYARKLNADPAMWTFATVADPRDLPRLLELFGIVVLPDGRGDYVHNAALFKVDANTQLSRAYDIDRPDQALADLLGD